MHNSEAVLSYRIPGHSLCGTGRTKEVRPLSCPAWALQGEPASQPALLHPSARHSLSGIRLLRSNSPSRAEPVASSGAGNGAAPPSDRKKRREVRRRSRLPLLPAPAFQARVDSSEQPPLRHPPSRRGLALRAAEARNCEAAPVPKAAKEKARQKRARTRR